MNPPVKLIAVDEDGTFVRPDYSFDRVRFARLWERMQELGVRFVVATGNQHHQVRQVFGEPYQSALGIVAENGAYVADGNEEVWFGSFEPEVVELVVRSMRAAGAPVLLDGVNAAYAEVGENDAFCQDLTTYFPVMQRVRDLSAIDDRIVMLSSVVPEERCDAVMGELTRLLDGRGVPVPSGWGYFDVLLPHTNKATGVARLAERWGIPAEACACFGNSYNDLEMIEWAGLGVYMEDAPNDLKAKADRIAPSCTKDGVLTVMEQLLS